MKPGRKRFILSIVAALCLWVTPATVAQSAPVCGAPALICQKAAFGKEKEEAAAMKKLK